ncbi:MAG: transglycosylase domain-containing protein [Chloroflexota bacterium]
MASVTQVIRRRHRRQVRRQGQQSRRRLWTTLLGIALLVLVVLPGGAALGGAAAIYWQAVENLPTPGVTPADGAVPTEFYDSSGASLVYTLKNPLDDTGSWVSVDTLPPYLISATLAAEDSNFLTRTGFNPLQTLFDLWRNTLIGTLPPDSSISGRLVRNVIAPLGDLQGNAPGGVNDARGREIALIAEINRLYTPRQILEWHLNTNYYGNEAYGIEAAAQIYLNKRAVDLTLDEAALLAAISTAPQYNPFSSETAARGRQSDLLRSMRNINAISQDDFEAADALQTPISRGNYLPPIAPEFTVYARQQAERILDSLGYDGSQMISRGSLRITTTLDLELYNQSVCVLQSQLDRLALSPASGDCPGAVFLPPLAASPGAAPPDSGSLVILDATTGAIRSMVGAATDAQYQPGPALQPFVYLTAFIDPRAGYTPATMVFDIPNQYPGSEEGLIYTISNPDARFRGPMNLRNAMGAGLLPPTADIAYQQGMNRILQTAHQLGLNSLDENSYDLMLLERGGQVSTLDMAYSYSVFATLGDMRGVPTEPVARGFRSRDPVAVLEIQDADGDILWQYDAEEALNCGTLDVCTNLLQTTLAYVMNDVLADQETRWSVLGQGSALDLSRPGAVVNGVTSDKTNDWTVGYSPQYVVGVALDRSDGAPMTLDSFGMNGAAPVWRALMEYVHSRAGLPPTGWERPDEVVDALVCDVSGLLPNSVCPVHSEIFLDGTQPRETDSYWQSVEINNQTGQRATVNTPPELRSEARFFVPPEGNVTDWWVANQQPLPPSDFDNVSSQRIFDTVHLTRPALFEYVGGSLDVYAELDTSQMNFFQLEYGQGLNPTQWFTIGGQQTRFDANAPVGTWNTSGLDGLYSLRLAVVLNDNTRQSDAVQVTIDNTAPTVALNSLEPGKIYRWPTDQFVSLQADAEDNLRVERVEFYRNNELLGSDVAWPFTLDWRIDGLGQQTFTAIAFDAVGNQSSSQLSVDVLRSGS